MKPKRDFKGIWIPKEVWENTNLSLQEKVFYVEIDSLNNEDGCFASNDYFAKFFNLSKKRVSIVIQELIKKGLITANISIENGNTRTLRTIPQNGDTLSHKMGIPMETKQGDPIPEKGEHSNTVNNKINNTTKETTAENIKKEFFENPIMEALKKAFPNRNYELEFDLMINWWLIQKKKLPKNIAAFKNWLSYTKPSAGPKIIRETK